MFRATHASHALEHESDIPYPKKRPRNLTITFAVFTSTSHRLHSVGTHGFGRTPMLLQVQVHAAVPISARRIVTISSTCFKGVSFQYYGAVLCQQQNAARYTHCLWQLTGFGGNVGHLKRPRSRRGDALELQPNRKHLEGVRSVSWSRQVQTQSWYYLCVDTKRSQTHTMCSQITREPISDPPSDR